MLRKLWSSCAKSEPTTSASALETLPAKVRVIDEYVRALAPQRLEQRRGANVGTFTPRKPRDGAVEFFTRGRMAGAEKHLVFPKLRVKQRQARSIAVHQAARQIERPAKSRTQARGANALRPNLAVLVEHDGLDAGARRFSRRGAACGSAAHDHKFGLLYH